MMEALHKIEMMMAGWHKDLPHLPSNGRKWLSENAWWLVLVGAILSTLGILSALFGTVIVGLFLTAFGGAIGAAVTGVALIVVLVSLAFAIVNTVLAFVAIGPLKAMQKRGWTLLLVTVLLNVASIVLSFLIHPNPFSLVWGLIFTAIGAYFLFEVRDHYHQVRSAKKVRAKKA